MDFNSCTIKRNAAARTQREGPVAQLSQLLSHLEGSLSSRRLGNGSSSGLSNTAILAGVASSDTEDSNDWIGAAGDRLFVDRIISAVRFFARGAGAAEEDQTFEEAQCSSKRSGLHGSSAGAAAVGNGVNNMPAPALQTNCSSHAGNMGDSTNECEHHFSSSGVDGDGVGGERAIARGGDPSVSDTGNLQRVVVRKSSPVLLAGRRCLSRSSMASTSPLPPSFPAAATPFLSETSASSSLLCREFFAMPASYQLFSLYLNPSIQIGAGSCHSWRDGSEDAENVKRAAEDDVRDKVEDAGWPWRYEPALLAEILCLMEQRTVDGDRALEEMVVRIPGALEVLLAALSIYDPHLPYRQQQRQRQQQQRKTHEGSAINQDECHDHSGQADADRAASVVAEQPIEEKRGPSSYPAVLRDAFEEKPSALPCRKATSSMRSGRLRSCSTSGNIAIAMAEMATAAAAAATAGSSFSISGSGWSPSAVARYSAEIRLSALRVLIKFTYCSRELVRILHKHGFIELVAVQLLCPTEDAAVYERALEFLQLSHRLYLRAFFMHSTIITHALVAVLRRSTTNSHQQHHQLQQQQQRLFAEEHEHQRLKSRHDEESVDSGEAATYSSLSVAISHGGSENDGNDSDHDNERSENVVVHDTSDHHHHQTHGHQHSSTTSVHSAGSRERADSGLHVSLVERHMMPYTSHVESDSSSSHNTGRSISSFDVNAVGSTRRENAHWADLDIDDNEEGGEGSENGENGIQRRSRRVVPLIGARRRRPARTLRADARTGIIESFEVVGEYEGDAATPLPRHAHEDLGREEGLRAAALTLGVGHEARHIDVDNATRDGDNRDAGEAPSPSPSPPPPHTVPFTTCDSTATSTVSSELSHAVSCTAYSLSLYVGSYARSSTSAHDVGDGREEEEETATARVGGEAEQTRSDSAHSEARYSYGATPSIFSSPETLTEHTGEVGAQALWRTLTDTSTQAQQQQQQQLQSQLQRCESTPRLIALEVYDEVAEEQQEPAAAAVTTSSPSPSLPLLGSLACDAVVCTFPANDEILSAALRCLSTYFKFSDGCAIETMISTGLAPAVCNVLSYPTTTTTVATAAAATSATTTRQRSVGRSGSGNGASLWKTTAVMLIGRLLSYLVQNPQASMQLLASHAEDFMDALVACLTLEPIHTGSKELARSALQILTALLHTYAFAKEDTALAVQLEVLMHLLGTTQICHLAFKWLGVFDCVDGTTATNVGNSTTADAEGTVKTTTTTTTSAASGATIKRHSVTSTTASPSAGQLCVSAVQKEAAEFVGRLVRLAIELAPHDHPDNDEEEEEDEEEEDAYSYSAEHRHRAFRFERQLQTKTAKKADCGSGHQSRNGEVDEHDGMGAIEFNVELQREIAVASATCLQYLTNELGMLSTFLRRCVGAAAMVGASLVAQAQDLPSMAPRLTSPTSVSSAPNRSASSSSPSSLPPLYAPHIQCIVTVLEMVEQLVERGLEVTQSHSYMACMYTIRRSRVLRAVAEMATCAALAFSPLPRLATRALRTCIGCAALTLDDRVVLLEDTNVLATLVRGVTEVAVVPSVSSGAGGATISGRGAGTVAASALVSGTADTAGSRERAAAAIKSMVVKFVQQLLTLPSAAPPPDSGPYHHYNNDAHGADRELDDGGALLDVLLNSCGLIEMIMDDLRYPSLCPSLVLKEDMFLVRTLLACPAMLRRVSFQERLRQLQLSSALVAIVNGARTPQPFTAVSPRVVISHPGSFQFHRTPTSRVVVPTSNSAATVAASQRETGPSIHHSVVVTGSGANRTMRRFESISSPTSPSPSLSPSSSSSRTATETARPSFYTTLVGTAHLQHLQQQEQRLTREERVMELMRDDDCRTVYEFATQALASFIRLARGDGSVGEEEDASRGRVVEGGRGGGLHRSSNCEAGSRVSRRTCTSLSPSPSPARDVALVNEDVLASPHIDGRANDDGAIEQEGGFACNSSTPAPTSSSGFIVVETHYYHNLSRGGGISSTVTQRAVSPIPAAASSVGSTGSTHGFPTTAATAAATTTASSSSGAYRLLRTTVSSEDDEEVLRRLSISLLEQFATAWEGMRHVAAQSAALFLIKRIKEVTRTG